MAHRTPRCEHGQAPGTCVVRSCEHYEGDGSAKRSRATTKTIRPISCHACHRRVPQEDLDDERVCRACRERRAERGAA